MLKNQNQRETETNDKSSFVTVYMRFCSHYFQLLINWLCFGEVVLVV